MAVVLSTPSAAASAASTTNQSTTKQVTALFRTGLAEEKAGNLAQADADFLQVLKMQPKNQYAWFDLGVIAQNHGYASQAKHDYVEALTTSPKYTPALYNLATVVAATSPSGAATLYEKLLTFKPNYAAAHFNLGLALRAMGQTRKGDAQIAKAVSLDHGLEQLATADHLHVAGTGG